MAIEDDKVDVITEDTEVEEIKDDETGKDKEEEDKGKAEEEGTDEIDIEKLGPEKIEEKKAEEEDDDDTDPDDKARITKIVDKKVVEAITKATEMGNFLKDNPQFAKYEKAMELYRNHPNYKNTPLKDIAAIVGFKDAERIGAAKEREAQKKVLETKDPGTPARKSETSGKDWSKATPDEVEAQRNRIVYGGNN